jgi:hypothetical protein
LSAKPETLHQRCEGIFDGCGEAIDWVREVRDNSPRIDREADGLIGKLRRTRNLSRRLGAAAMRPMSIGFFGLSQAGKSYLISVLAADEAGNLKTEMDGEVLDFIAHINPPGGGKEATGLVTRFSRHPSDAPKGYPVALTLFSEADLAKVLGNSFFNDFDTETVTFNTAPDHIRQHLATLEKQRQPNATGGMTEDDMVDLLDYFERRFKNSMEPLMGDYWPTAIELAPYLPAQARGQLLSVLWGEIPELTDAYLKLSNGLSQTGNARAVFATLDALVQKDAGGALSQAGSIMNVDILERLGKDDADTLAVLPKVDGEIKSEIRLPRSYLAALTAEMHFCLDSTPKAKMLDSVDLLDFPGYRGRLKVASMENVRAAVDDDSADPVAQLILRGKVAYLFERYTEDQEMNILLLCTPSHKQMDVNDIGPVLDTWIKSTQGATVEERGNRKPGLCWCITMFDMRLAPVPGQTVDIIRQMWPGLMKMALLERFGSYDWVKDWAGGKAFDNLFLVRKPKMAVGVIETKTEGGEIAVVPEQVQRMQDMRDTFVAEESVIKHVRDPGDAWDAMMTLNDGGMDRLIDYLETVAVLDTKLTRVSEQIDRTTSELVNGRLGPYYLAEGAGELEKKKKLADEVIQALSKRPDRFGELLHALQPSTEHLRGLYLRAETVGEAEGATLQDTEAGTAAATPTGGGLIDLAGFDTADTPTEPMETDNNAHTSRAGRFAKAAMSDWIKQIRGLPDDADLARFLGFPPQALQRLAEEIITAVDRFRIEDALVEALHRGEVQTSITRSRLADQQVLVTTTIINNFIDNLGAIDLPPEQRPASRAVKGQPIFAPPPPIAPGALPELPASPINYPAMYILDWFEAFRATAVGNAGHTAGRDITPDQNEKLGQVLQLISGQSIGNESTAARGMAGGE